MIVWWIQREVRKAAIVAAMGNSAGQVISLCVWKRCLMEMFVWGLLRRDDADSRWYGYNKRHRLWCIRLRQWLCPEVSLREANQVWNESEGVSEE
jgi:hypothetical protein